MKTVNDIMHLFIRTNFAGTMRLNLVKKSKSKLRMLRGWEVQTQKIRITMIYISSKKLQKMTWYIHINLVEAIIRHQKPRLTYK